MEASRPERRTRRSHVKSKQACSTCKGRRIRCDQGRPICRNCLRYGSATCSYDSAPSNLPARASSLSTDSASSSKSANVYSIALPHVDASTLQQFPVVSPDQHVPAISFMLSPSASYEDIRIKYHFAGVTGDLVKCGNGHALSFGTWVLPDFLEQAMQHQHVRDAIMCLSTYHLSMLTQDTALDSLTYTYQARACNGLRVAVEDYSETSADALLASSIILAWTSLDSKSYAHHLKGICSILGQIRTSQTPSKLSSLFSPLPALPTHDNKALALTYLSTTEADLLSMRPLITNVKTLTQRLPVDSGAYTAAKALLTFLHNLRLPSNSANTAGSEDEAKAFQKEAEHLFAVKTWVPFLPTATLKLSTRDPWDMVVMAYYHAVMLAAEPYLPRASRALFLWRRTGVVGHIWTELMGRKGGVEGEEGDVLEEALEMAVVPLVYAVRFRVQHPEGADGAVQVETS